MDVTGRTGEEACRHALILMAQSASRMTKAARKNRKVQRDEHGSYVENFRYVESGRVSSRGQKLYKWMFQDQNEGGSEAIIPGTWENAKRIGHRGMAKRSWMWGLGRLGRKRQAREFRQGYKLSVIRGKDHSGYIYANHLSYVEKAMPAGWESAVKRLAGNKIMAQARKRLEGQWKRAVERREKRVGQAIGRYFLKAA